MVLALDVAYKNNLAKCVGLIFEWENEHSNQLVTDYVSGIEEYQPGIFFKRELPCLVKVIEKVDLDKIDTIIIDGYVYVSNDKKLGLGGELWKTLGEKIPVIGVAKNKFHNNTENVIEVLRGLSKKPLYVSAIGISQDEAANHIMRMKGNHRIPTLLKQLDNYTKHSFEEQPALPHL